MGDIWLCSDINNTYCISPAFHCRYRKALSKWRFWICSAWERDGQGESRACCLQFWMSEWNSHTEVVTRRTTKKDSDFVRRHMMECPTLNAQSKAWTFEACQYNHKRWALFSSAEHQNQDNNQICAIQQNTAEILDSSNSIDCGNTQKIKSKTFPMF